MTSSCFMAMDGVTDAASALIYLAGDEAAFIGWAAISLDGGLTAN